MISIFVDSSALIALGSRQDKFFQTAQQLRRKLVKSQSTFITTHAVILEVANYFSQSQWRSTVVSLINDIYNSKTWQCFVLDDDLMKEGFNLYQKMTDKN